MHYNYGFMLSLFIFLQIQWLFIAVYFFPFESVSSLNAGEKSLFMGALGVYFVKKL